MPTFSVRRHTICLRHPGLGLRPRQFLCDARLRFSATTASSSDWIQGGTSHGEPNRQKGGTVIWYAFPALLLYYLMQCSIEAISFRPSGTAGAGDQVDAKALLRLPASVFPRSERVN
jgi:hypothetical protein